MGDACRDVRGTVQLMVFAGLAPMTESFPSSHFPTINTSAHARYVRVSLLPIPTLSFDIHPVPRTRNPKGKNPSSCILAGGSCDSRDTFWLQLHNS